MVPGELKMDTDYHLGFFCNHAQSGKGAGAIAMRVRKIEDYSARMDPQPPLPAQ